MYLLSPVPCDDACVPLQASIESIGESMALAEKNGVDRERVMSILSSSIFDCLIYKVRAVVI